MMSLLNLPKPVELRKFQGKISVDRMATGMSFGSALRGSLDDRYKRVSDSASAMCVAIECGRREYQGSLARRCLYAQCEKGAEVWE